MKVNLLVFMIALCSVPVMIAAAEQASTTYGPIKRGDTLYRIAVGHQQDGIELTQLILSIYENNPQAFDRGDINRLKIGSTLTIPNVESLAVLSPVAAAPEADVYGPVRQNESLYRIAAGYLEDGLTMAQIMMSIYEANPRAFVDADINNLETGSMLTIPTTETIAAVNLKFADSSGDIYGPVQRGETLYRIAVRHQRDGTTLKQLMQTIHQSNPKAFFLGDINRLKVGSILIIPVTATAPAINSTPAVEQRQLPNQIESMPTQIDRVKPELEFVTTPTSPTESPKSRPTPETKPKKAKKPLFRYSYDLSIVDDDNVRLAQNDVDIRGDLVVNPSFKIKAAKSLDNFSILNYGASVAYSQFDTFDALNHYEFDANIHYRFAFSTKFTSPIYSFGVKLGGIEFESDMRDSTVLTLSTDVHKWLTNKVNMTAGLGLKMRESASEVYDTSEARIFVNFDNELTKKDLIYTTIMWITGDTVSSATPSLDIINAAEAIEPDDAFGGIAANQFAYRLESETTVLTLGYNRVLTRDLSLDASVRLVETESRDNSDIGYERTIFRVSLLGRF